MVLHLSLMTEMYLHSQGKLFLISTLQLFSMVRQIPFTMQKKIYSMIQLCHYD